MIVFIVQDVTTYHLALAENWQLTVVTFTGVFCPHFVRNSYPPVRRCLLATNEPYALQPLSYNRSLSLVHWSASFVFRKKGTNNNKLLAW